MSKCPGSSGCKTHAIVRDGPGIRCRGRQARGPCHADSPREVDGSLTYRAGKRDSGRIGVEKATSIVILTWRCGTIVGRWRMRSGTQLASFLCAARDTAAAQRQLAAHEVSRRKNTEWRRQWTEKHASTTSTDTFAGSSGQSGSTSGLSRRRNTLVDEFEEYRSQKLSQAATLAPLSQEIRGRGQARGPRPAAQ